MIKTGVKPVFIMVLRRGLEPPRGCPRQHLKLVRIPIPPPEHARLVELAHSEDLRPSSALCSTAALCLPWAGKSAYWRTTAHMDVLFQSLAVASGRHGARSKDGLRVRECSGSRPV